MGTEHEAIVAGHICLDIFPDLSDMPEGRWEMLFRPGSLLNVGPVTLSTGGAVSNTGLALHRLGVPVCLIGKIGDDLFGQAVRQIVESYGHGLGADMVVDGASATSYTVVINPPGVDRIFLHCPGANDTFTADDISYELLAGARLFHFGYPPLMKQMFADGGAQLTRLFRRAKEMGITTSLDMALPDPSSAAGRADWLSILQATAPYVDVFLPSIEEILYMLRRDTYNELARKAGPAGIPAVVKPSLLTDLSGQLLKMGMKVVGFKLGERGLYVRTGARAGIEALGAARPSDPAAWADRELWSPCFEANVVGTTGAGDATIAGFLGALLRDMTPEEAVTIAVAVGACNVEAADALSGIRSWDETVLRVERGWARHQLILDEPGWRLDPRSQVWVGAGRY